MGGSEALWCMEGERRLTDLSERPSFDAILSARLLDERHADSKLCGDVAERLVEASFQHVECDLNLAFCHVLLFGDVSVFLLGRRGRRRIEFRLSLKDAGIVAI